MKLQISYIIQLAFVFLCIPGQAQQEYYPYETSPYYFIHSEINMFNLFNDSTPYQRVFDKFDTLIQSGTGQLRIVHIGGSHIQADIYTHRMRQRFNSFEPGITGPRGFIFPYKIAQTNNPSNYNVHYTGSWTSCKNTQREENCELGLSGYSVTTNDSFASIRIRLNIDSTLHFEYNKLKVFCPNTRSDYQLLVLPGQDCKAQIRNEKLGFTEYYFDKYFDTLELQVKKTDELQHKFELYGISFESDDPGVIYSAVGVNGAKLESYLRCSLFTNHLQALKPDLVIVSIGTNDGYTRRFNSDAYRDEFTQLISEIKESAPDAAILLTVPNDSYLYRRYINKNTAKMEEIIYHLAAKYSLGVWDFYSIMGGLNSAKDWYDAGLMNGDHVHFNKQGYILNGDLLFAAFIKTWEEFLKN